MGGTSPAVRGICECVLTRGREWQGRGYRALGRGAALCPPHTFSYGMKTKSYSHQGQPTAHSFFLQGSGLHKFLSPTARPALQNGAQLCDPSCSLSLCRKTLSFSSHCSPQDTKARGRDLGSLLIGIMVMEKQPSPVVESILTLNPLSPFLKG